MVGDTFQSITHHLRQIKTSTMHRYYILGLLLLFSIALFGQQEQQYTQFMYNKLAYNPGYAGSKGVPCFTLIYRNQWIGLEGSPEAQVLSFNTLTKNNRVGLGLNFARNTIGISERWTADGVYAYKINMKKATIGIGLQASVRYYGVNYSDNRLVSVTPLVADGAVEVGAQNKYLPNFGMGIYVRTDHVYLGVSLPRLLKNNLDFNELGSILSSEVRHVFGMVGAQLNLGKQTKFFPQVLVKYSSGAPIDFDFNLSLILQDRVTVGGTYRHGGSSVDKSGESLDFLFGLQASERVFVGFSYDMTLSEIKEYSKGSVEALVQYCITKSKQKDFVNPRYF